MPEEIIEFSGACMNINFSRPLISHLKREIENGDIIWALLWANEYREENYYFVRALYAFAEKTGRLSIIEAEVRQKLFDGLRMTEINLQTPVKTTISANRRLKTPSLNTLDKRFNHTPQSTVTNSINR